MKKKRPEAPRGPRVAAFHPEFREDLRRWVRTDRATALRILELVEATLRDPFEGIGKPEPLRFHLQGCWSRRVTEEGGYEAQGLTKGFGGPGFFAPEAEDAVLNAVRELLRKP